MIPKCVVQTSEFAPEPQFLAELRRRVGAHWDYRHFTDADVLQTFAQNPVPEFPEMEEKFRRMPTGAHKGDLFRYFYLFVFGGVFIDSDAEPKAPLDPIVEGVDFFTVRSTPGQVFQGFIGCSPGHELMHKALGDAYRAEPEQLNGDFHMLCAALHDDIERFPDRRRLRLLDEIMYDNGVSEVVDERNATVLLHYFATKHMPRRIQDTRSGSPLVRTPDSPKIRISAEVQDAVERIFAHEREGRLEPHVRDIFVDRLKRSGNAALLDAFLKAGAQGRQVARIFG